MASHVPNGADISSNYPKSNPKHEDAKANRDKVDPKDTRVYGADAREIAENEDRHGKK